MLIMLCQLTLLLVFIILLDNASGNILSPVTLVMAG